MQIQIQNVNYVYYIYHFNFKIWNGYGQLGKWEVTKNNYCQYKLFKYDPKILVINTKF